MKNIFTKIIILVFSILLWSGLSPAAHDPLSYMGVIRPQTRVEPPDFTLMNLEGKQISLAEFKGKVILLNFWATWCIPCREEMPAMEELWKKFREKGFVIIAVSSDRGNKKGVKSFIDELGVTFPILLDPKGEIRNTYEVLGLPMSYIIGRDGKIVGKIIGARDWTGKKADTVIEYLLQ